MRCSLLLSQLAFTTAEDVQWPVVCLSRCAVEGVSVGGRLRARSGPPGRRPIQQIIGSTFAFLRPSAVRSC